MLVVIAQPGPGEAQTLRLRDARTKSNRVTVQVGATVTVEVFADLQGVEAAGVSFFITVPDEVFQVIDQNTFTAGVQPFATGPLFADATIASNLLVEGPDAEILSGQPLEYSTVLGLGSNRRRTGTGVVATFSLLCIQPIINGQIRLENNPARETRLVLSDGVSEQRFRTVQGMEITATGIQLRDIPDVILLPGESDSTRIGQLSDYVQSSVSPVEELTWTFEPANIPNVEIEIDPETSRVKIVPDPGWTGEQRVTWVVHEAAGLLPGQPPLENRDASAIVVNNQPRFTIEPDEDGIKRHRIVLVEDRYPFVPGAPNNDPQQAYRGLDLDLIVEDPDITDPQTELRFAVLPIGKAASEADVLGQDDETTHELLLWTRPNFFGLDSLRVIVADNQRGQDTLRVIVEVEPEADPPVFILENRQLKLAQGGSKTYLLSELVADPDTPLDELIFSWDNDPDQNFTADTLRGDNGLEVIVQAAEVFLGEGRIAFAAADPQDPVLLRDTMVLFLTASDALPPTVFPSEIKVGITPGGPAFVTDLNDFVEDPDNDDEQLVWSVPAERRSVISIDEARILSVSAPGNFVGYEQVPLTVTDPSGQGDQLVLRIYSSDGRPVVGGLPDLILDRGQVHQDIDLDEYYFDADDDDGDMFWQVEGTFDDNSMSVGIEQVSHLVTIAVADEAPFGTETLLFEVTDPGGESAQDTMLVSIRSGGGGETAGSFSINALPELEAPVNRIVEVFNLNDFVTVSGDVEIDSLSWTVQQGSHATVIITQDNLVRILGEKAGVDTVFFTAADPLGRRSTASTVLRVFGENDLLKLRSIPDILFIAGERSPMINLGSYVLDRETHPDSLLEWDYQFTQPSEDIFVRIDGDSVTAIAFEIAETEVVFIGRNTQLGVTGRDTVRVLALDPALAVMPLKDLPPIVFEAGDQDSSVVLDEFLPEDLFIGKPLWSVAGQEITNPLIDLESPHRLRLGSVGDKVGVDSLTFTADLGGGFKATGLMEVTVVEPIDTSTLDLQVVPNPINGDYLDIYVLARRSLAGLPNVIRSFGGEDSTVVVRQTETGLVERGVLIWGGQVQLPFGASGRAFFQVQALTALGTAIGDTTSIAVITLPAAKGAVLHHGNAAFTVPAGALDGRQRVYMQNKGAPGPAAAKTAAELVAAGHIELYPANLVLQQEATLRLNGEQRRDLGFYRQRLNDWHYLGRANAPLSLVRLGTVGLFRDVRGPVYKLDLDQMETSGSVAIHLQDLGSGIDPTSLELAVNGTKVEGSFDQGWFKVSMPAELATGHHHLVFRGTDRAGNGSVLEQSFYYQASVVPQEAVLAANYPNPFNSETVISFVLPAGSTMDGTRARLVVYNLAGQAVRLLYQQQAPWAAGQHSVRWDGRDAAGERVASGVYLYRLELAGTAQTRRMTLLK